MIWGDGKMGGGGGRWESEGSLGRQVSAEKGHLGTTARFQIGRRKKSRALLMWSKCLVLAAHAEYTACHPEKLIGKYYSAYSFRLVCF